jgi:repressor LexA
MTKALTTRQREILEYIIDNIRDYGRPPTIVEIGERFDIASTNGVNDHLLALAKKGFIERSSKARSIQVTQMAAGEFMQPQIRSLPLLGRVAAGLPVFSEENVEAHVAVSAEIAGPKSFCLRVQGESMIEAGILHGDTIVVDLSIPPRTGSVVVALVNDETTVKYFYPRGEMIELRPANSAMQSILVPARDVQIQGVVVALQRTLR